MTNEVILNILTRRSVRAFQERPVEREKIDAILRCAVHAPSAMNRQTWHFSAVLNPEKIQKLAAAMGSALGSESYNLYRPAALIIPSNETGLIKTWDNACALENIFLAAHSLGVASVWINQGTDTCDDPGVRAVLTELGVPKSHMVYGMAALGYAAAEPKPVEKKYPGTRIERVVAGKRCRPLPILSRNPEFQE